MTSTQASVEGDLLLFELGGQRYALPASQVREIVRAVTVLPLPKSPPLVEGVINVRGSVLPVLDIRARFRLPAKPACHTDHLIVAWANARVVAIRADRALALVDPGEVVEPSAVLPSVEYVAGVAKLADGLVLIHDLGTFLHEAEARALDEALDAPSPPGAES